MSGLPAAEQPTEVTVTMSRYTVSALPKDFKEAWRWDLTVTRQRDGLWVIEHAGMYLTVQDQLWSESKADAARITGRSLAVAIAKQHAPNVIGAGLTPTQAIARAREQLAGEGGAQ